MSIEGIKTKLNEQITKRNENNEILSISHDNSMLYAKEVVANESLASQPDKKLGNISGGVSSIINEADNLGYRNTYHKLIKVTRTLSKKYYDEIIEKIRKGSETTYNTYKSKYDGNTKSINTTINQVKMLIKEYNKLKSEIEGLRMQIHYSGTKLVNGKLVPNDTSSLETRKSNCEKRQKALLSKGESFLNRIEKMNTQNKELLEKGLARV